MLGSILTKHKSGSTLFILVHKYFEFIQTSNWGFYAFPESQEKCNSRDTSFATTQLTHVIFWFPSKGIKLNSVIRTQPFKARSKSIGYSAYLIARLLKFIRWCIILAWNYQHINSFLLQVDVNSTQEVVCSTNSSEIFRNSFFHVTLQLMQN